MKKAMIDMWMIIGLMMMLLVFAVLLYFQQAGQDAIRPSIAIGGLTARVVK